MKDPRLVADGFLFLESPRWHDGELFVSDFYGHCVFAIDASAKVRPVCEVPNQPSGLGFAPDGSMLIVSMLDRRVLRYDEGVLDVYADLSAHVEFLLNDMLVDRSGRAYVGNLGFDARGGAPIGPTGLSVIAPDGSTTAGAHELVFPNGMAVTPDGTNCWWPRRMPAASAQSRSGRTVCSASAGRGQRWGPRTARLIAST